MLLNVTKVSKAFPGNEVLREVSFHMEEKEKAALVGINGAGKSTLLKIMMGELPADDGSVTFAKDLSVGYLAQHQEFSANCGIFEELMAVKGDVTELDARMRASEKRMSGLSGAALEDEMAAYARMQEAFERKNGYAARSEVTGILKGLGFTEDEFDKPVQTLSGGQKTRVALGRLLLTAPDLIILDEPTNHLDMHSIEWLETWLVNYRGAVLIVSHDRYFLNRVVTKVFELSGGRLRTYTGNYDAYSRKKEELRHAEMLAYLKAEAARAHEEAVIAKLRQFNREKSIKRAESRVKKLDKMEMPERPEEDPETMRLTFSPARESGKDVLEAGGLKKSFGKTLLFEDLGFLLQKGERAALIGMNGTGKSTLLKILTGRIEADAGYFTLGANVEIGYYDQEMQNLAMEKTIFEELQDAYPSLNNTRIHSVLAAFLFTGEDVFKRIGDLSGGERARVSLAKLMLGNANLILLDEPTNHLDIESREILESALNSYTGTLLFVSHDRYFINRVATRIMDLTSRQLLFYGGNYDYYLEKKETVENAYLTYAAAASEKKPAESRQDWQAAKDEKARVRKRENDLKKTEARIEALEAEDAGIDEQFNDPAVSSDPEKCLSLGTRKTEIAAELEVLYEKWSELTE